MAGEAEQQGPRRARQTELLFRGGPTVAFLNPSRRSSKGPIVKPHAGINTDWSGDKCAVLNKSSSYALQPAPSVHPQAPQPAPPAPPKPAADPVTVGQAARDHVHQESAMSSFGFDVAIGLGLALAFAVVRRFVLDMIEPPRPSL
jgi:hypothetical protein